jgi:hypothetical protein
VPCSAEPTAANVAAESGSAGSYLTS